MKWTIFSYGLRGGAFGNLSSALAAGLASHGIDVEIVYLARSGRVDSPLSSGVRAVPISGRARWSFWPIARHLRRRRPDVFVALGSLLNGPSVVGRAIARVPCVLLLSEHATMSYKSEVEHADDWLLSRVPSIARALYGRADGVITVSEGVMNDLVDNVGVDAGLIRIASIPNPVDIAKVQRLAGQRTPSWFRRLPGEPLFVSMGRLARQKNHHLLIEAFDLFVKSNGGGQLVIMGDGPLRHDLELQVEHLELGQRVTLSGTVENPFPVLAQADAFLLSSEEEGFGLVLVEAMALGIAIVATDCPGGVREVLDNGQAGLLVTNGDPAALRMGMERILNEEGLATKLTEAGLKRASDYLPEVIAQQWLTIAAEVSAKPRSARTAR